MVVANNIVQQVTMERKSNPRPLWGLLLLIATFCSCMGDIRHIAFVPIDAEGWSITDTLVITIAPLNDVDKCGLSLLLHTDKYEYANIAFDISVSQDSIPLYHEQHSYLLENSLSEHGIGRHCEYILPVDNVVLCDTLPTTITLVQQLNQPLLAGIHRMGVRVSSPLRQPGEPVWRVNW